MVEKAILQDLDTLQVIQNKLLITRMPYHFPGIAMDATRRLSQKIDGTFFDVTHPTSNLMDIMYGQIKGEGVCPFVMALAVKMELLRLAKPFSRTQHYDRNRLWEKNILSPQEVVKKLNRDMGELLSELGFVLNLFYGRFNLEYNTFAYIDCGFNKPLYYNAAQNQAVFLTGTYPALGTEGHNDFHPIQMTFEAGDIFSFYSENLKKDANYGDRFFNHYHLIPLIENQAELKPTEMLAQINQAMNEIKPKNDEQENSLVIILKTTEDKQLTSFKHATAKFASDLSQLQAVRSFVQRICQQTPGDTDKLNLQMQLVINEIFCNIVKHGYHQYPKGEIIIESQLTDDGVYFTLSDKGDTFNPAETKYPNLTGDQEDGFGFFIIQQIADQISYTPKTADNEWNHLRIFKRYFSEEDQMDFSHHIQDQVLIIVPKGDNLDAKNAPSFKENVLNLIRTSGISQLVFDLHQLQFIDSSGLGTFLSIQRMLNAQGGILKLANLNKPIRTMFEIVSMHRIFDIFNSTEEAIVSF